MVTETGEPILEELTQELEQAHQEILRLKGYAVPSASLGASSTGLASSASAEGKAVRLRGIAISEGTHNGKYYPWEELSKDSFVGSFIGKPVVVDHKEGFCCYNGAHSGRRAPVAGALGGIRVVEMTRGWAGPGAAMYLADQGAQVIKVEPPGGDEARRLPRTRLISTTGTPGISAHHRLNNHCAM